VTSRAKAFALSVAAVGSVVLVAVPVLYWEVLQERYQIWLLDSGDEKTRLAAAGWLGTKRSTAAVPKLMGLLVGEERETYTIRADGRGLTPIAHAIYLLGLEARPNVLARIEAEKRKLAAAASSAAVTPAAPSNACVVLSVIHFAWQEPGIKVERIGYSAE